MITPDCSGCMVTHIPVQVKVLSKCDATCDMWGGWWSGIQWSLGFPPFAAALQPIKFAAAADTNPYPNSASSRYRAEWMGWVPWELQYQVLVFKMIVKMKSCRLSVFYLACTSTFRSFVSLPIASNGLGMLLISQDHASGGIIPVAWVSFAARALLLS